MRRHFHDAAWIAGGQIAAAVGTVLGVRLLTELLAPTTFGVIALALGAAALATNIVCTPLTQAAMHFYPVLANQGGAADLRTALFRALRRSGTCALLVLGALALLYAHHDWGSVALAILLAALFAFDCVRLANLSLLNASRQHKTYALWLAADTCLRPLLAATALWIFGASAEAVLAAYVLVSLVLAVLFGTAAAQLTHAASPTRSELPAGQHSPQTGTAPLERRLWSYAVPLIPLGLVGWANGLGDRYIIGGMMSVADAGLYAAIYGLASRPFIGIQQMVELVVRPVYQAAVSRQDFHKANRLFVLWLAAVTGAGLLMWGALMLWRVEIAALLLGKAYRGAAPLLPWIAAGYLLLSMSYVFERVCYAHAVTRRVFMIQAITAVAAVMATLLGTSHWGLIGAAAAVPVYFSVQLAMAALFAYKTHRQVTKPVSAVLA